MIVVPDRFVDGKDGPCHTPEIRKAFWTDVLKSLEISYELLFEVARFNELPRGKTTGNCELKIWKSGLLRSRQDCVGEVVVKEAHFVIDQPPNKSLEWTRDQIVCGPLSSSVSARGIATNRGFNVKKGAEGAVSGLTLQHCA